MRFFLILIFVLFANVAKSAELINNVFDIVEKEHIKQEIIDDLAMSSLKALNKIDKNVLIANDNTRITLYYKAKVIRVFGKPKINDAKNWAETCNKIIDAALKISPILRTKQYEIEDIVLAEGVSKIADKSSKFYPSRKFNDYRLEHKRNFTSKLDAGTLYIALKNINETTFNSIKTTIKNHKEAKQITLDLKHNQGGNLKSAIDIINLFVDGGIIFSTKGRDGKLKLFEANEGDIFEHKPINILVDEKTASAAELIAYVLSYTGRAKVFGSHTFGKNSVQTLFLVNGGGLAITTDYFYGVDGKAPAIIHQPQQNP